MPPSPLPPTENAFTYGVILFPAISPSGMVHGFSLVAVERSSFRLLCLQRWAALRAKPGALALERPARGQLYQMPAALGQAGQRPLHFAGLPTALVNRFWIRFPHKEAASQVFIVLPESSHPPRTPGGQTSCQGSPQGYLITAVVNFRAHVMHWALRRPVPYKGETEAQKRGFPEATQICGKTRP